MFRLFGGFHRVTKHRPSKDVRLELGCNSEHRPSADNVEGFYCPDLQMKTILENDHLTREIAWSLRCGGEGGGTPA